VPLPVICWLAIVKSGEDALHALALMVMPAGSPRATQLMV
jgi:hypothetical protein